VALEIRQLIRAMSLANPLWGAPRIHCELLKLGIDVGQTSVAKYMATREIPEETPAIARGHEIQKSPESRLKVGLWLNSAEKETVTK
jgi:hypothetical protein